MVKNKKQEISPEKLCALLSYILVGLVWYFFDEKMKKNSFVKFHVKQGIILLIAELLWALLISALFWPLVIISLGTFLPIFGLLRIIPVVWIIIGILNVLNNKQTILPLIGKYAKKLGF